MEIALTKYALITGAAILVVFTVGFGYQMTWGNGQNLKAEDRRWWRFDWIWPPVEHRNRDQ